MAVQRLAEFYNEQVDIVAFEAKNRRYVDPDTAVFVDPKHKTQVHVTIYAEDIHAIVKAGYKRPTAGDLAMRIPAIMAENEDKLAVIISPDGEEIMINRHRQPEAAVSNTSNVTQIPEQPRPTPAPVPTQQGGDSTGNGNGNIYAKMARVMGMMQRIPKTGKNAFFGYEYATEGDIADAVRKAMAEVGLAFFSEITDWHRESSEITKKDKSGKPYQALKWTTYLKIRFTFACAETGATIHREWYSEADDDQDKGIAKAVTLAQKYFFKSTFVISTGDPTDDPDSGQGGDEQPTQQPTDKPTATQRKTTTRKPAQQSESQKPAAPQSTPAKTDDNNAPGDVTKKILNDKSVQKAWQSSKEALNTINKMWREGELTADMDEADMILSVIERLESHKKAEAKS